MWLFRNVVIQFAKLEDQAFRIPVDLSIAEAAISPLQLLMPRTMGFRQREVKRAVRAFRRVSAFLRALTDMYVVEIVSMLSCESFYLKGACLLLEMLA